MQGNIYEAVYDGYAACAKFFYDYDQMVQELGMLEASQDSECVPELHGVHSDGNSHIIVMELVQGKNLYDILQMKPSKKFLHTVFYRLGHALLDLHATGVIHNDLKFDNIMIEQDDHSSDLCVRIIDLGMSTFEGGAPYPNIPLGRIMHYPHLDPYLCNGGKCSRVTDLYSLGAMLLQMAPWHRCPAYGRVGMILRSRASLAGSLEGWLEELREDHCRLCRRKRSAMQRRPYRSSYRRQ